MTPADATAYFAQGFVPNERVAAKAIADLTATVLEHKAEVAGQGFEEVMLKELESRCAPIWNLTLTGGLDSRFVLAMIEMLQNPGEIKCYTWGPPTSKDVQGASIAAKHHAHTVLDTRSVDWHREDIVQYLRAIRPAIGDSLPRLDAVWLYRKLSKLMAPTGLRLNGYLGDMLSGAHLIHRQNFKDDASAFAAMNSTGLTDIFDASSYYSNFCRDHADLLDEAREVTCFTTFDLLDYAFRQKQRIEPVMRVDGKNWVSPFNSPKVIAKWAMIPLDERSMQRRYRATLNKYIGDISVDRPRSLQEKIRSRVAKLFNKYPTQMKNLADPTVNASLRDTMETTCLALDARNLAPVRVIETYERLRKRPSKLDWNTCMFAMSLELHLQTC